MDKGCYYIHPLTWYNKLPIPPSVKSVVIMGDPRYRYLPQIGNRHSLEYRARISKIFADSHGLPVTIREPRSADDDLAFMSRARHLVPSRGGFGAIITDTVLHHSGSVFLRGAWISRPRHVTASGCTESGNDER